MFKTMLPINLRWNLSMFAMVSFGCWIVFAVLWFTIALVHGDLVNEGDSQLKPCMQNVDSLFTAFIFSVKNQHVTGYGYHYTTKDCPAGVVLMCVQGLTGFTIYCLFALLVYVKIVLLNDPSQALVFSRFAVVCLRNGKMYIMWRVCDLNKSTMNRANISGLVIRREVTGEGEGRPIYQKEIEVDWDYGLFMYWPVTIMHEINERSPFYNMPPQEILKDTFELVVMLEGTIERTGQYVLASTTFLPNDILWGRNFVLCQKDTRSSTVDYSKFHSTYEVDTPLCSASDYYEYHRISGSPSPSLTPAAPEILPLSASGTTDGSEPTLLQRRQMRHRSLRQTMSEL